MQKKLLEAALSQLPLRLVYNSWRQLQDMLTYYVMLFEQVRTHYKPHENFFH